MIYTIENEKLKVVFTTVGATIKEFVDKETNTDIVLGFDTEEDYLNNRGPFFGATVGRYANRIGKGTFELNGITYHTPINNTVNTLHGGEGLSFKEFELVEKSDTRISFSIFSKDGDDGFPGNVKITVIYELIDNKLVITFKGISDKDTVLNLTNHSYFNLDGGNNNLLEHEACIYTDKVAILDKNGLSTDITKKVDGTSFDFREFRKIKDNLALNDDNLSCGGIDHNYVFETMDMKKLITLRNEKLSLSIYSDLPGVQIYTSNFLNGLAGKYGYIYNIRQGMAIEPQFYPNSINYDKYLKPIVKANEEMTHTIEYVIERRK